MIQPLLAKHLRRFNQKGFTLVEMMVALAVSSVLMLMLVKFVQTATTGIVSGEDQLFATNDAQAAMDLITTDLQSVKAVRVPVSIAGTAQGSSIEVIQGFGNGATANPGVTLSTQGSTKPGTANIYPMDLYLLATPPATYSNMSGGTSLSVTGAGTPHLIRYKLVWQDPVQGTSGTSPVMALYRDYVSSSATFGFGATSSSEVNNSNSGGLGGLYDLYANYWSNAGTPPVSDLLVSNIFDFQILLYDVGSTTPTVPLNQPTIVSTINYFYQPTAANSGQTFHLSSQGLFIGSTNPSTQLKPYSNLVAEVRMTLVNQQGVTIFNTGSLGLDSSNLSGKYAHVYIRRVPISL